ncbi:Smg-4/UPF3 family-domain-containing protein [Lentinula raphanica]|nr:Smg-4/UPF3 family-domain-containing protein [Lentinula raphanica]
MSTTVRPSAKSKKEKTRGEKAKDNERKEKPPQHTERLKTVVRKLPSNLPEDIFWQSVQNWVTDQTVSWKVYYPGKLRTGLNKENVPSRAYIAFRNEEQLALFSKEYDGHLFRDKSGNESQAVVEFAPYQKVPPDRKKIDPRNGTIERDENYISFIESLNASAKPEPVSIEALIASTQPVPQPKTTPLLEALKAEKDAIKEKAAMKEKVAIMRNTALENARKDDAAKKKGGKANELVSFSAPPPSTKKPNKKAISNTANTSGPASTSTTAVPPVKPGGPPAKSVKAARQPPSQPPTKVLMNTPSAKPPSTSESQTQQQTQTDVPSSTAPPRRARPILGLASRQFEAALSGAGVNAGDRKSRREREASVAGKEKEKEKDQDQTSGGGAGKDAPSTSAANIPSTAIPTPNQPPHSPRRDRSGAKRKSSVSINSGTPGVTPVPKVPSILQRAPAVDTSSGPAPPPPTTALQRAADGSAAGSNPAADANTFGRGGRRGRGRGRGGGGGGGPMSVKQND